MCEEERNTLEILLTENINQSQIFKDKTNPIVVSLENGIKKAEKKLQDCEYKQCMSQFYDSKLNTFSLRKLNLELAKEKLDIFQKCLELM